MGCRGAVDAKKRVLPLDTGGENPDDTIPDQAGSFGAPFQAFRGHGTRTPDYSLNETESRFFKMRDNWGGKRPGAGRPKGSEN